MVDGQASDLYASDMHTWLATSRVQGLEESLPWAITPPLDPALARSHLE
jgi:hypothetical protein